MYFVDLARAIHEINTLNFSRVERALYPLSFDPIHSHCRHDDVKIFLIDTVIQVKTLLCHTAQSQGKAKLESYSGPMS
jgi:hypothetical protein